MQKVVLILLFSLQAHAGKVKLNWLQTPYDSNGNFVQLTKFTVFWGFSSDNLANVIELGPPVPLPWRTLADGRGQYAKTLDNPSWQSGSTVCFAMSSHTDTLTSGLSNILCKTLSGAPGAPDIINLDEIP